MYLKEIKLVGFKSFADKTILNFENGIAAVVGPNGSGKSNIVDAVRWVLGEQSIKSLRGDGNMSDVIFSGSKTRPATNSASVTLIFDNSDKYLNLEYAEVSVKRTIFRTGENEYYINNTKCRLKDIVDLFCDTGASKEAFNIISQGNIQQILSSKAEERRIIFEEAAGVLKYKRRKEEALKRLEKTTDNMARVQDIIKELEINIDPLESQAKAADKYLEAKENLEKIEIALLASDINKLNNDFQVQKKMIINLNDELLSLNAHHASMTSNLQTKKLQYLNINENLKIKRQELLELTKENAKLDSEKAIILEREKNQSNDVIKHQKLVFCQEQKKQLESQIVLNNKKIAELEMLVNNLEKAKSDSEIDYTNKKNDKRTLEQELTIKIKQEQTLKNEIEILENNINNQTAIPYAVRQVINNPKLRGIRGVISDLIDVPSSYVTAIETALGAASNFVVVDTAKIAEETILYLKQNNLGRVTFFPKDVIKSKFVDPATIGELKNLQGFINIASNLIKFDNQNQNIIENQLGNVIIADNLANANKISSKINNKYKIVTLDGELIHVGGSLTGGSLKGNKTTLQEKLELQKLKDNLNNLMPEINHIESKITINDNDLEQAENLYYQNQNKMVTLKNNLDLEKEKKATAEYELPKVIEELKSLSENYQVSNKQKEITDLFYKNKAKEDFLTVEITSLQNNYDDTVSQTEELETSLKILNLQINQKQEELKKIEINQGKIEVELDSYLKIINEEYGLTYEKASQNYFLDLDVNSARNEVNSLKRTLKNLGEVNLGAKQELERVKTRYEFLMKQYVDLEAASISLKDIISQMDEIVKDKFLKTFKQVEKAFEEVFKILFKGGNASLNLTNPGDLLNTGIDIVAMPPGKKLPHLSLMSGGEKSLTALALLFSILKVRPVPFCVLDEVEAALDDPNAENFCNFLETYRKKTQFIIITHKKKTMEYADILYGITMQESGVSRLVSVKLEDYESKN